MAPPPDPFSSESLADLRRLAYHEAAHAIVAYELGLEIESVTIVPNAHFRGRMYPVGWQASPPLDAQLAVATLRELELTLIVFVAGVAGEAVLSGAQTWWRGHADREADVLAERLGWPFLGDLWFGKVRRYLLTSRVRFVLGHLATALAAFGTVDGARLTAILARLGPCGSWKPELGDEW